MSSIHQTVLLKETIQGLNLKPGFRLVDCTFGGGGHSLYACESTPGVKIVAIDQDAWAFDRAKTKFTGLSCDIKFVNDNFRNVDQVLREQGIAEVDALVFDLGLSSDQLTPPLGVSGRGFSFMKDEPLIMTMKANPLPEDLTAFDIVNTWSEENLATILMGYGEERFHKRIAHAITESRKEKSIETTFDLVHIIEKSVPASYKRGKIHCATRTFQALRMAVNDELGALLAGLTNGFGCLKSGGRMAVISFHSIEDRIVKNFFKTQASLGYAKLVNKKVITTSPEEAKNNPRSRSAKLRILEKI